MKLIIKHLQKLDYLFLLLIILDVVCQVALELKMPDYTKALSTIVATTSNVNMSDVIYNGLMMVACAVGSMLLAFLNAYFLSTFSARVSRHIRSDIFKHVSNFSLSEFNKFDTSSLITRDTNDVVQIQNFLAMGTGLLFRAPITAIWAICKISNSNSNWTLATTISVLIMVLFILIVVLLALPKFKKIQTLNDELNLRSSENMSGVRVIRAFDANDYQTEKFEKTNQKVYKNNLFLSYITSMMMPMISLIMEILTLAIYWIGAYLINDAPLSDKANIMGDMIAYSSYSMQVVMSFIMLIGIFMLLPRVIVSANRISEVLNTKPSITDGSKTNEIHKGEIEFKNISFSYNNDESYSVSNLNFKINKGETVAIIGPTGCGKTTIVNLINRAYDASRGEILIDGMNVKDYKLSDLNSRVSIAHQKAALFKGTVKSNISYGNLYDDQKAKKALSVARADFVYQKEGVETEVAQGATNFSGGQKQRLSIARTLYKDSDIYIFDDTFSALDFKTDQLVRKGIKENYSDKTIIIVAQRIGTIKNADKIIVLNDGSIDSIGTHSELLEKSSLYKEIALSQLDKEEL